MTGECQPGVGLSDAPLSSRGFGFYPILAYLDGTGEGLAGRLRAVRSARPGKARPAASSSCCFGFLLTRQRRGHPIHELGEHFGSGAVHRVVGDEIRFELTACGLVPTRVAVELLQRVGGQTTPVTANDFNFNVELAPGTLPIQDPSAYEALDPVAAYVALPAPLIGLPAGTTFLEVPTDGTPPPYAAVLQAMQTVVARDPGPGNPPDLAALTPVQ